MSPHPRRGVQKLTIDGEFQRIAGVTKLLSGVVRILN